ncbi:MAG TPA: class I SAM-dependent methyltransferase [Pyrinomonadaceae bacterium]|jgi:SAM-dependent methyltransferase|nr:class I SAM-dependent methyltransferase [Pyrinomonadaceae bacterium]
MKNFSQTISQAPSASPVPDYLQRRKSHERLIVQRYESTARQDFNPTENTRYLNIGYWKEGARNLDEAAEAMTRLVAEAGQFGAGDSILDVGCGFGDSALFWVEQFDVRHLTGIDINPNEVAAARKRIDERGLSDRIDLRVGSAVEMPFENDSFDKVVALEAAHHFLTREDFFRESYRVLRSNGRLVTADVIPLSGRTSGAFYNPLNAYSKDVYVEKLRDKGFTNISAVSIRDHVFRPYSDFIRGRLRFPNLKGAFNVALHRFVSSRLDYLLVTADKPPDQPN